jgi:hypothetical protein
VGLAIFLSAALCIGQAKIKTTQIERSITSQIEIDAIG